MPMKAALAWWTLAWNPLWAEADALSGFEQVLKPAGVVNVVPLTDGGDDLVFILCDVVAHAFACRKLEFAPFAADMATMTLPRRQVCEYDVGPSIRCSLHTAESLSQAFALDDNSLGLLEEHGAALPGRLEGSYRSVVVLFDSPVLLQDSLPAGVAEHVLQVLGDPQAALAERAQRLRRGRYEYARCSELCSTDFSIHQNRFDLVWLLAPLWGGAPPEHITIVNLGCAAFASADPLHSLLDSGALLSGLCIDSDSSALAAAAERLQGHLVQVVEAFLTPDTVASLLKPAGVVDVFKIKLDSFDADVLEIALATVRASVLITEWFFPIPPPFEYARHHAHDQEPDDGTRAFGMSLSFLVDRLGRHGFLLYKLDDKDALWVHQTVAERFERAEPGLRLPVDEWACYLRASLYVGDNRAEMIPMAFTREWLLADDMGWALRNIQANLSSLNGGQRFTLDLSAPWAGSMRRI